MTRALVAAIATLLAAGCAKVTGPDDAGQITIPCSARCQTTYTQCTGGCVGSATDTAATCQHTCERVIEDCLRTCERVPVEKP